MRVAAVMTARLGPMSLALPPDHHRRFFVFAADSPTHALSLLH
jgi:hypothetical protein